MGEMEKEFVDYLRYNGHFNRLMIQLRDNYKRLGHLGGTIKIPNATCDELHALEGLLGLSFDGETDIKITYQKLLKRLAGTKFEQLDFTRVLALYFNKEIVTNRVKRSKREATIEEATQELMSIYQDSSVAAWFVHVQTINPQLFSRCINQFLADKSVIIKSFNAINQLPFWQDAMVSLSVFAADVTTDPHFFDKGLAATILHDAIYYFLDIQEKSLTAIERNKILLKAGLMKEDALNYCITSRIFARTKDDDEHTGLTYFGMHYEPLNLNVANLLSIDRIEQAKLALIVENPSVFHQLNNTIKIHQLQEIALICSGGELNLAAHLLLDKLHEGDILMYYAGDFDPEGLLIADKLKRKYGSNLILWGYKLEEYKKAKSTKLIDDQRLEKLKNCVSAELEVIKEALIKHRNPGYQEALIPWYQAKILELDKKSRRAVEYY